VRTGAAVAVPPAGNTAGAPGGRPASGTTGAVRLAATLAAAVDRRLRTPAGLLPAAGVVLLVAAWQAVGSAGLLGDTFPPLTAVLQELEERDTIVRRATVATGMRALTGGLVGLGLGIGLATLLMWLPRLDRAVIRMAVLLNAIPVIALGPMLLSTSLRPYIGQIFAAMSVLLSTLLTVSDGYRAVPSPSHDVFTVYGAPWHVRFLRLQLPTAAPMIADAVRIAVPAAVLGAVLGEWFGADRGLGVLMITSMQNLRAELLWGAAAVAAALSAAGYAAMGLVEAWARRRFGRAAGRSAPERVRVPVRGVRLPAGLLGAAALVAAWQATVSLGDVQRIVAPRPLGVLSALAADFPTYAAAAGHTAVSAAGGLVLGSAAGFALAVVVALFPLLAGLAAPISLALPAIPIVVIVPIMGRWVGYNGTTVLLTCVLMAFFPVFVLVAAGMRARPAGADDLFRVCGAGRVRTLMLLDLPAAVPNLLVAVRLSAATCFLGALSAEWLIGQAGLGHEFSMRRSFLQTDAAWAAIVVAVALSVATYQLAERLETWVGKRWL
jgi:ABC-type nitrate/sulfonate/bicarbonate transport system permease component